MGKRSREAAALTGSQPSTEDRESKKARKNKKKEKTVVQGEAVAESAVEDEAAQKAAAKAQRKAEKKAKKSAESVEKAIANGEVLGLPITTGSEQAVVETVPKVTKEKKEKKKATLETPKATADTESQMEVASQPTPGLNGSASDYTQNQTLSALPQSQIDEFLSSKFITITDPASAGLRPITEFKYLPRHQELTTAFGDFTSPSPIQAAAWPFLLAGRDAIGVAETGSGKTLAFGLPCVRYVKSTLKGKYAGIKALILSPTRELASQIYDQLEKLGTGNGVKVVCLYGGVPKDEQRQRLRSATVIVATPGRLNDFIQEGAVDLGAVGYLVLDEADRMLDKGFEEDIRRIIGSTPTTDRQTCMFTATWPTSVRELAATFMKKPVRINIGDNPTGELRANTRITQTVEVVDPRGKEMRLLQLVKQYQSGTNKDDRILVFCLYKKEATRVEGFLRMKGLRVAGIHGDMTQPQRTASLEAFKSGKVPLLVATDVAARGLDIPAVKVVINVTFPLTVEDYVHRIGRTGRAGSDGLAITLFTDHDKAQSGAYVVDFLCP